MSSDSHPPTRLPVAIAAEALAGLLSGAVMAVLFAIACALVLHWTGLDNQLGMGSLGVTLLAGLLGFAFGAAIGVAFAGRRLHQQGSFWLALTGVLIAFVLVIVLSRRDLLGFSEAQLPLPLILSLALAVLGYNLRRQSPG